MYKKILDKFDGDVGFYRVLLSPKNYKKIEQEFDYFNSIDFKYYTMNHNFHVQCNVFAEENYIYFLDSRDRVIKLILPTENPCICGTTIHSIHLDWCTVNNND